MISKFKHLRNYSMLGDGIPVLCLSGFGCTHEIFHSLCIELGDKYQFILPNNRGMGESPPATQPYLLDDLAQDALDIMDELNIEYFHLIGISMGGFIAQLLALKAPLRVKKLALLCTSSSAPEFSDYFQPLENSALEKFYKLPIDFQATSSTDATVHPTLKEKFPKNYKKILDMRLNNPVCPNQAMYQNIAVTKFLSTPIDLKKIKNETLILSGGQDRFVVRKNSELLAEYIPDSRLEFIDETDHFFFMERPDLVGSALDRFLFLADEFEGKV